MFSRMTMLRFLIFGRYFVFILALKNWRGSRKLPISLIGIRKVFFEKKATFAS